MQRTVYMRLGSQMDDTVDIMTFKNINKKSYVKYVAMLKMIIWFILDVLKIFEVTSIGQLVKVNDRVPGILVCKQSDHM